MPRSKPKALTERDGDDRPRAPRRLNPSASVGRMWRVGMAVQSRIRGNPARVTRARGNEGSEGVQQVKPEGLYDRWACSRNRLRLPRQ